MRHARLAGGIGDRLVQVAVAAPDHRADARLVGRRRPRPRRRRRRRSPRSTRSVRSVKSVSRSTPTTSALRAEPARIASVGDAERVAEAGAAGVEVEGARARDAEPVGDLRADARDRRVGRLALASDDQVDRRRASRPLAASALPPAATAISTSVSSSARPSGARRCRPGSGSTRRWCPSSGRARRWSPGGGGGRRRGPGRGRRARRRAAGWWSCGHLRVETGDRVTGVDEVAVVDQPLGQYPVVGRRRR